MTELLCLIKWLLCKSSNDRPEAAVINSTCLPNLQPCNNTPPPLLPHQGRAPTRHLEFSRKLKWQALRKHWKATQTDWKKVQKHINCRKITCPLSKVNLRPHTVRRHKNNIQWPTATILICHTAQQKIREKRKTQKHNQGCLRATM